MNISIYNKSVLENYKSNSQIARVLTESWCSSEMYCPNCLKEKIVSHPNNQKAYDFMCENCKKEYQLKSANKKFGKKILDGEYKTMTSFIQANKTPNFFLMHYSNEEWVVKNFFVIPSYFISLSSIEKRNPLSETARRAGWTGCNISLEKLPEEGKIQVIRDEKIISREEVNKNWKKMFFLNNKKYDSRGWTSDVLKCVNDLKNDEFDTNEIYKFSDYLKELHPQNNNVEAKIRQQLQILRDQRIIKFSSRGKYKRIS